MNYPGVLARDPDCMEKLRAFAGRHIDGHAPLLSGRDLNAYLSAGIRTEHEATSAAEATEKLQKGMRVLIREGSVSKDLDALAPVLTPLTANTTALKNQIKDYSIAGYTGGGTGVQWSYYMLSPKWRDTIRNAGLGDGPADHDPKEVAKIAILMTDGEFNTVHADVPSDRSVRNQASKARANAEAICGRMKADGIEIFTIGFKLPNAAARNVMKNCASPDTGTLKHYYETSSGTELNDAFMTIARNIEALALTQ